MIEIEMRTDDVPKIIRVKSKGLQLVDGRARWILLESKQAGREFADALRRVCNIQGAESGVYQNQALVGLDEQAVAYQFSRLKQPAFSIDDAGTDGAHRSATQVVYDHPLFDGGLWFQFNTMAR